MGSGPGLLLPGSEDSSDARHCATKGDAEQKYKLPDAEGIYYLERLHNSYIIFPELTSNH